MPTDLKIKGEGIIMKVERYDKDFFKGMSGGSVLEFSGDIFQVNRGGMALNGASERYLFTEVSVSNSDISIRVKGHHKFKSDEDCLVLFSTSEILNTISTIWNLGISKGITLGRNSLKKDIKNMLQTEY